MEVKEFESYLTMDELANFKKNVEEKKLIKYHEYIQLKDAKNVIAGAFGWADSEQGHAYWSEIQNRLTKGEPLTSGYLKGHKYMRYFTADQWSELCTIAMEFLGIELYSKWMEGTYTNMTNFLGCGIPTSKQSKFVNNIRVADSKSYRMSRGYQVTPGEFLTKVEIDRDTYTSTTRIHETYEIR